MNEVPYRLGREFGEEFEVEVAQGSGDSRVTVRLHAFGFQHVFFVGEEGALGGRVRGQPGGCEGGGGAAGGVLGCVVGFWGVDVGACGRF